MSTVSPTLTEPRVASLAAPRSAGRSTLLLVVIVATSSSAFGLSLWSWLRPQGAGEQPDYASLATMRTEVWAFYTIAGVQLAIGVAALAVAGLVLAPRRGSRWAFVGACLIWAGAACYAVGIGGWASAYYVASDGARLGAGPAASLVAHVNDDALHVMLVPIAGAVAIGLGSLVLVVGIWRAGTVPRWLLVVTAVSGVATFLAPPSSPVGLVLEGVSSLTGIAIGWYAWRTLRGAPAR